MLPGCDAVDPLNVWDADHPRDRHFHLIHTDPQVRYRANVQEVKTYWNLAYSEVTCSRAATREL